MQLSDEQARVFWDGTRISVLAGGEGSGKSFIGALKALTRGVAEDATLGWIVGADFEDARMEADYVIGWADELNLLRRQKSSISASRGQGVVLTLETWNGGLLTIATISAYDPLKLGREEPDFIIGCEVSRWETRETWDRCFGRLARKFPNAWGYFSGSFETSLGWFPEVWQLGQSPNELDVRSFSLPSSANRIVYPGGELDPALVQLRASMSPERFLARHTGKPAPPHDAIFPEFKTMLHVQDVPLTPDPVYVFIDPGTNVYAVLFVQLVGDEVHVVDEVYLHGASHEQVVQAAQSKRAWKNVMQTREGVIDTAGAQHHMGFGSAYEAWRRDTGISLKAQYVRVDATVERIRSTLMLNPRTMKPRLLIAPRCRGLISELGGGPSPVPGGGLWRMKSGQPEHKNDHACKALGYGLVTYFGTARPAAQDSASDMGASYLSAPRSLVWEALRGTPVAHNPGCACVACRKTVLVEW